MISVEAMHYWTPTKRDSVSMGNQFCSRLFILNSSWYSDAGSAEDHVFDSAVGALEELLVGRQSSLVTSYFHLIGEEFQTQKNEFMARHCSVFEVVLCVHRMQRVAPEH